MLFIDIFTILWALASAIIGFGPYLLALYLVRVKKKALKIWHGFGLIFVSVNIILINAAICAILNMHYLVEFCLVLMFAYFILLFTTAIYLFVTAKN